MRDRDDRGVEPLRGSAIMKLGSKCESILALSFPTGFRNRIPAIRAWHKRRSPADSVALGVVKVFRHVASKPISSSGNPRLV